MESSGRISVASHEVDRNVDDNAKKDVTKAKKKVKDRVPKVENYIKKRVTRVNNKTRRQPAPRKASKDPKKKPSCYATLPGLQDLYSPLPLHRGSSPLLPLTEYNLRAHTQQTNPGKQPIIITNTMSATTGDQEIFDNLEELRIFGVVIDSQQAPPPELRAHVLRIRDTPRQDNGSPSAGNIMNNARVLQAIRTEPTVISILCPNLMFRSAIQKNGEKFTWWEQGTRLNPEYVTRDHKGSILALTAPITDACNGYLRRGTARLSPFFPACPFTEEEEAKLLQTPGLPPVLLETLVPFLTAQFKTSTGQGLMVAKHQSARDGAAICEYLHRLFTHSKIVFSETHTCHWSVTCNTQTTHLFLHWREQTSSGPRYHMTEIGMAGLTSNVIEGDNPELRRIRDRLRNI
ncbi:uncharacterized protein EKO05_0001823 [Ascochyta rabiei]|uniref:uncharacterized protein n=1 Tax=Didymella rabiei TaxID=5454 RepID=UPI00220026C6|nr:uncharacterized protein EKO05_0001823 [Ascochyta rabiei]UPX11203.1 hypothetical protein EKO05_0001823 [Ascochyta rabiei]